MGNFSKKELEAIDSIVDLINVEIFSIEQGETDKGKLDYSLCSNNYEKQKITKKKIKKFKLEIDKCPLEIAPYLHELIKPSLEDYGFYDLIDKMSKEFITSNYLELIDELAKEENFDFYQYTFSSVVKSKGYKYKPLKNYIKGVSDVIHYLKYKSFLEIPLNEKLDYNQIITKINNAFFRLEAYMKGTISEYYHFDFNEAFTELFYYTRNPENFNHDNCKRVGEYWKLTEQIGVDYDQSDFDNLKAYNNNAFNNDCNTVMSINRDRIEEFQAFATKNEIEEDTRKYSISYLIKPNTKHTEVINNKPPDGVAALSKNDNPYPRIFKTTNAFIIFKKLVDEFGNSKENLANYSFVYHRMKKDELIYDDFQKLEFTYFLLNFDVKIDRIKRLEDIGKIALRESIYTKSK